MIETAKCHEPRAPSRARIPVGWHRRSVVRNFAIPRFCCVLILSTLLPLQANEQRAPTGPSPIEENVVENFVMSDFRGKRHALEDYAEYSSIVLVFLGTECPLVRLYAQRLVDLGAKYGPRGVKIIGINSNSQDSISELSAFARVHNIDFPLLKDIGNRFADRIGAQRTPEIFVLDADRHIRYRGRIDDQYGVGYARESAEREDLRTALEELLAGKPISVPETSAVGCHIGRIQSPRPDSPVTYGQQIVHVFHKHCVECHRDGQIAPFALTEYDEIVGWAETISEVVREGRMPPWNANPEVGEFRNARTLSEAEKKLIYDWVRSGAPAGDLTRLPREPRFVPGWQLPSSPDVVIPMREKPFTVPDQGTVEYQYFVVDPGFESDRWVSATEVVPGNRAVVHHAIVFVRPPGAIQRKGLGWLGAYVPGQQPMVLPPGRARLVPAGSKLIFQLHYTPNGSIETDITKIGINFADPNTINEQTVTLVAVNRDFEIPPYADNFLVTASQDDFPSTGILLGVAPHMHVRGRSFRFVAYWPDRPPRVIADIPRYDFNWQHVYEFKQPLSLSKELKIECHARFDNSSKNLVNPDPSARVRWGDQTWEEMAIAFFEIAVPLGHEFLHVDENESTPSETQQAAAEKKTKRFFARFDQDHDNHIVRDEVPTTFAVLAFHRFDKNNDDVLTRPECFEAALDSQRQEKLPF